MLFQYHTLECLTHAPINIYKKNNGLISQHYVDGIEVKLSCPFTHFSSSIIYCFLSSQRRQMGIFLYDVFNYNETKLLLG